MKIIYLLSLSLAIMSICVYMFYLGKEVEAYKIIKQIEDNRQQKVFNFYKKIYNHLASKRIIYGNIQNATLCIAVIMFILSFIFIYYGNC